MKSKTIALLSLAALLAGCGNDEPKPDSGGNAITVKSEADRTILIADAPGALGSGVGKVYNLKDGSVYASLPHCMEINDMTMYGEEFYIAGKSSTSRVTYWTNHGQEVVMDEAGTAQGVVRTGSNIYVYVGDEQGAGTVYRNGVKHAQTNQAGSPVAFAANGENFYALGLGPKLWTNSGVVKLPDNNLRAFPTNIDLSVSSQGTSVYVTGHVNNLVNGVDIAVPCLWINGNLSTLPLNFTEREQNSHTYQQGWAWDVSHKNMDLYAVGSRFDGTSYTATVWVHSAYGENQVKTYWHPEGNIDSQARRTLVYGSDVYVMVVEYNHDTNQYCTRIWMNHELKGTLNGVAGDGFVVI